MDNTELRALLPKFFDIMKQAGDAILAHRKSYDSTKDVAKVEGTYHSVQTIADRDSDAVLYKGLSELTPHIPVITEENVYDEMQKHGIKDLKSGYFWILDPMDGTSHFREGRNTWAVLGALIKDRKPIMGIAYRPAEEVPNGYYAIKGEGAFKFKNDIHSAEKISIGAQRDPQLGILVAFESQYMDTAMILESLSPYPVLNQDAILNNPVELGAKMQCLIAEGKLDFEPFLMENCAAGEWDVAATSLIVHEAGGTFRDIFDNEILFGTPNIKVQPYAVYANRAIYDTFSGNLFDAYAFENGKFVRKPSL